MNDYTFGERIYRLRTKFKISQSELGKLVGVSNKAVSKWETGVSKPGINIINKLSSVFRVSVEDLLNDKQEHQITKIVLTGGPCAGKTTAQSWIQNEFSKKGYQVIFINEAATDIINSGLDMDSFTLNKDFQKTILKYQLEREQIVYEACKSLKNNKILIVCDRGTLDGKTYMSNIEYRQLLEECHTNEIELRDSYDAIFHLVSAAKGASEYYTLENNKARRETLDKAIIADEKIISAYTGHPHFRIIDNSTDFKTKMIRLIAEISSFLGEPEPYEIERKYLIEYPDIKYLESLDNCDKVEIIQTYLISENENQEIRIRQRGKDGNYIYTQTIKETINDFKRIEKEKRLTKEEYLELLMNADPSFRQIRKTRYCLSYNGYYYEIDIFPFMKNQALMEVELKDENEYFTFPKFIKILKEVSDDINYKNHSLAKIK
jgi:CYTH domain-containing protein/transcriptional regulator with XRE-family HTH domain